MDHLSATSRNFRVRVEMEKIERVRALKDKEDSWEVLACEFEKSALANHGVGGFELAAFYRAAAGLCRVENLVVALKRDGDNFRTNDTWASLVDAHAEQVNSAE